MKKMYLSIFVLVATLCAATAFVSEFDVIKQEWEAFKLMFEKTYEEAAEDLFRMKIFMENKHKIAKHNQLFATGKKSFKLRMNGFGDLLHHEFVRRVNGFQRRYNESLSSGSTYLSPANVVVPKQVNWTAKGYVTPVKNQGQCGSCWSFSATGSLEGQHFRKTKKLVSLSEQNLIDCSGKFGNEGCNGGLMDQAFDYIKENKGIDTEEAYPYKHKQGRCHYKKQSKGATDTGFVDLPSGDETKLMEAVATIGPISVAIDASQESFQFYSEGVYNEPQCSSEQLDHGVLCTGYGVADDSGEEYWIVKNSWGAGWGEGGYIKMAKNKNNQCGIATQASYPLV